MATRNVIKGWFQTRDKPTQSQFYEWIDSCFFPGEDTLSIDKIANLTTILNNKADYNTVQILVAAMLGITLERSANFTYFFEAGKVVEAIAFTVDTNSTINIGTSAGGTQIIDSLDVSAGVGAFLRLDKLNNNLTTWYFTGIQPNTTIKIWYKQ